MALLTTPFQGALYFLLVYAILAFGFFVGIVFLTCAASAAIMRRL